MGAFDDLIPKNEGSSENPFADLIPKQEKPKRSAMDAVLGNIGTPQQMTGSAVAETPEEAKGTMRQFGQGALFGSADEAEAVFRSMFSDKTYSEIRDEVRGENKKFKEENPEVANTAEILGGASMGGAALSKNLAAKAGKSLGGKIVAGAITGAEAGGLYGAGASESNIIGDNADVSGLVADTALGAGIGALTGGAIAGVTGHISNKVAKNKAVREIIEAGGDGDVATKTIANNGKIITHEQAKKAVDQGFSSGGVYVARSASPGTKKAMLNMVRDYQRIKSNPRVGIDKQVGDHVGKAAVNRYNAIKTINKQAGQQVDSAAKALKSIDINVDDEVSNFISKLEDKGIGVDVENGLKVDFHGSDFEGLEKAQKSIRNVLRRMHNTKSPNGYDVHRLKKYIDNNISYGGGKDGAEMVAENMIGDLRKNLDKYLDGISPAYDAANKKYSKTIRAIKAIDGLAGKNEVTPRTLGILANRSDSRAISSGRVFEAFSNLDKISEEYGVRFKDSVRDLHIFANELDQVLPNQLNNSAKGQYGVKPSDAVGGVRGLAVKAADAAVNKITGVTPDSQIKTIKELLLSDGSFKQISGN